MVFANLNFCLPPQEQVLIDELNKLLDPLVVIIVRRHSIASIANQVTSLLGRITSQPINVTQLYDPADIEHTLDKSTRIDVLIITATCLVKILDCMPNIVQSERLQCIWCNETDELRQIDQGYIDRLISMVSDKQVGRESGCVRWG